MRIEELRNGGIDHALSIAVPCTKNDYVWPANHKAVPGYCNPLSSFDWPAMGQLFWLDLDAAGIENNSTTKNAPAWAKSILVAMHDHGAYLMIMADIKAHSFSCKQRRNRNTRV
jgi:hypothetical protein